MSRHVSVYRTDSRCCTNKVDALQYDPSVSLFVCLFFGIGALADVTGEPLRRRCIIIILSFVMASMPLVFAGCLPESCQPFYYYYCQELFLRTSTRRTRDATQKPVVLSPVRVGLCIDARTANEMETK